MVPHLWCFGVTFIGTTAAAGAVLLLDSAATGGIGWRTWLAAAAAGSAAAAFQSVFCPLAHIPHLVGAHGGSGLVVGALLAVVVALQRR